MAEGNNSLPEEQRPTVGDWTQAWQSFRDACKRLHELADIEGDELKIDVKYKAGAKRKKPHHG